MTCKNDVRRSHLPFECKSINKIFIFFKNDHVKNHHQDKKNRQFYRPLKSNQRFYSSPLLQTKINQTYTFYLATKDWRQSRETGQEGTGYCSRL